MRFVVARPRRLTALMHLLLFVFSTSTSLLPCAHESTQDRDGVTTGAHHASMATSAGHHEAVPHAGVPMAPVSDAPASRGSAPTSPDTTCPWVVGCIGMVQFDLDAPWRATESQGPSTAPVGVTLRQVTADRDVDSPPPRA